jgi:hypothetical protein
MYLPQKSEAIFTREDADELREYLSYVLGDHFAGKLKGEHVPGAWCVYCPLKRLNECTLYRSYYGTTPPPPLTEDQARKLARRVVVLEERRDSYLAQLKQYVNDNGPVALGSGDACEVFGFHVSESEEVKAGGLLHLLEVYRSEVGDQPLDELLSVNKRGKAYRKLMGFKEIRDELAVFTTASKSTRFGHKKVGGDDAD